MERENLAGDAKGKGTSGSNCEAESTDAPERGGLPRSSDEASGNARGAKGARHRHLLGSTGVGSTDDGRNPMSNGRRQPSRGGTSRMTRECQVRICERLGVKFPGPTRQSLGEFCLPYSTGPLPSFRKRQASRNPGRQQTDVPFAFQ